MLLSFVSVWSPGVGKLLILWLTSSFGCVRVGMQNGFANYPYLGSVVGPVGTTNDLGDSYNYNYIQAVQEGTSRRPLCHPSSPSLSFLLTSPSLSVHESDVMLTLALSCLLSCGTVPYGPAVDGASSRSTYTQYESHIWTLGANNELLPAWVNDDGSVYPGQSLVHWNAFGLDLIFVTGNVDKFHTGSGLATDIVVSARRAAQLSG